MKILCIKDVIMEDGEKTFTKNKEYQSYECRYFDSINCPKVEICAKNDNSDPHTIKYNYSDKLDAFYYKYFKEIK